MSRVQLLVVASAYEADRIRRAASAVEAEASTIDPEGDFAERIAAARPNVIVIASATEFNAVEATRRLRAAAGAGLPIVFAGEAVEADAVQGWADVCVVRPFIAEDVVSRALAFRGRGSWSAQDGSDAAPRPGQGAAMGQGGTTVDSDLLLGQMAARIDVTVDEEMLSALRTVVHAGSGDNGSGTERQSLTAAAGVNGVAGPAKVDSGSERRGGIESAGNLADFDVLMLLGRAFLGGATGRWTVRQGDVEKIIHFEAGRPVLAASSAPEDRMIETLLRRGRITQEQRGAAVKVANETGRRMGAILVDLGIFKASELLPAVRRHYEEIVKSLFAWPSGNWRFERGVTADPKRIRLLRHPAALVRTGVRSGYPTERIASKLGPSTNVFRVDLRGGASDLVAEITADSSERSVPLLLDGVRSLDEVVRTSGLDPPVVREIALALWAFGLLQLGFAESDSREGRPDARDRAIERERILVRHALALEGDYFQVLGLDPTAHASEIGRAYDRLVKTFSASAIGQELREQLRDELTTIEDVLDEALRVLGTPTLRAQYQANLGRQNPDSSTANRR